MPDLTVGEVEIIAACCEQFDTLDQRARARVLVYLHDRYIAQPLRDARKAAEEAAPVAHAMTAIREGDHGR